MRLDTFKVCTLISGMLFCAGSAGAQEFEREISAVRTHVAGSLGVAIDDVEILHLGLALPFACGPDAIFTVDSSHREDFVGNAEVRISAYEGTETCGQARVRTRVRAWRTVAVATSNVRAADEVGLVPARVSIEQLYGVPVPVDSGPWEARVDIQAGQPVTQGSVRAVPDNRSGEPVLIIAGSGALRVTANGRLLQSARVGDHVRVSNLVTDQVVQGVLIEPGIVRAGGEV